MTDVSDMRTMTLLNFTGDITIAWNSDSDNDMIDFISRKMKSGHSFFIVDEPNFIRRMFGAKPSQIEVKNPNDVKSRRKVVLDDKDAEELFKNDKVKVLSGANSDNAGNTGNVTFIGRAKTAQDVVKAKHVAVLRPIQGG